jgi:hypothetical protein
MTDSITGADTTGSEETTTGATDATGDGDGDTTSGDGDGGSGIGDPCTTHEDCDSMFCNPITLTCQPDCGFAEVVLRPPPPPVMVVLDKSGSMVTNLWDDDGAPGTPDVTRWSTLWEVTDFVLSTFEDRINFGLQLYPSVNACPNGAGSCYNSGACVVDQPEVDPAPNNRTAIINAMPAQGEVAGILGGTPARAGVENAVSTLMPLVSSNVEGAVILVTDGAANCRSGVSTGSDLLEVFDDQLEVVVGNAFTNEAIPTYVVGIDITDDDTAGSSPFDGAPAANPFDELNAIATAGGRPQMGGAESFYNATDQATLQMALEGIATEIASCDVDLTLPPNMPPNAGQIPYVSFAVGNPPEEVPLLDPAPSEQDCRDGLVDGWMWLVEGELALICGTYCDTLKDLGDIDGVYGCPPPD